jgi:hypothetical protein
MIRHAFYNGRSKGAKFIHKGILLVSDPHTHVETIFSDGLSFSSQLNIGPRFSKITYSHPERWLFVDFPMIEPAQERRMRYKAEMWAALQRAGLSSYDTLGAIGCAVTGKERPWDAFCSEVTYDIFPDDLKIPIINYRMHPQKLLEVDKIILEINT